MITLRERFQELRRIWGGGKRQVRYVAIGWYPGEEWKPVTGQTASGNVEYYKGQNDTTQARPIPRPSPHTEVDPVISTGEAVIRGISNA